MKDTLYLGLDTDSKHINVALAEPLPRGEVRYRGWIANEPASVERLVKRLRHAVPSGSAAANGAHLPIR